jgi:hypothetical protein
VVEGRGVGSGERLERDELVNVTAGLDGIGVDFRNGAVGGGSKEEVLRQLSEVNSTLYRRRKTAFPSRRLEEIRAEFPQSLSLLFGVEPGVVNADDVVVLTSFALSEIEEGAGTGGGVVGGEAGRSREVKGVGKDIGAGRARRGAGRDGVEDVRCWVLRWSAEVARSEFARQRRKKALLFDERKSRKSDSSVLRLFLRSTSERRRRRFFVVLRHAERPPLLVAPSERRRRRFVENQSSSLFSSSAMCAESRKWGRRNE